MVKSILVNKHSFDFALSGMWNTNGNYLVHFQKASKGGSQWSSRRKKRYTGSGGHGR